uniref:Uncharacterized protein n=1 Tax=Lotharella globosa TaxID=91324 RepID=A0A6V3Q7M5_9EUKA|mmetsp:Transcript_18692/g.37782  ORF Transcript_18692/g.37782 Transcript_18692/m.37782 type:complete len:227 (+) Transcript_18692:174-854(+)
MLELGTISSKNDVEFGVKYQKLHHPEFAAILHKAKAFSKNLKDHAGARVQIELFATDTSEPVVKPNRDPQFYNQGTHLFSLAGALEAALSVSFTRFDAITDKGKEWKDSSYAAATLSTNDFRVICRISMARTSDGDSKDTMWVRLFDAEKDATAISTSTLSSECVGKGWETMWDKAFEHQMQAICKAVLAGKSLAGAVVSAEDASRTLKLAEECHKDASRKMLIKD